jgi:FKBP-type peptidyl-prolyl cis-trans isomerase
MKRFLTLSLVVLSLVAAAPAKVAPKVATPPPAPADLDQPSAGAESLGIAGFYAKQLTAPTASMAVAEGDNVRIRYTIWASPGGKVVDWIAAPGTAVTPLHRMFDGLRLVLQQMQPGETRRVWIPESLGAAGRVPAGGHLVVDIDLVEIIRPPSAPHDVSAAPANATVTKSGLAYVVLKPGTGTKHPKGNSTVQVQYSGWTSDGKLVDSSVTRGEASELSLEAVIAGWREGMALMTEGEKVRFWIPSELAYHGTPNKPQGMLVFDIELLKIVK